MIVRRHWGVAEAGSVDRVRPHVPVWFRHMDELLSEPPFEIP